MGTIMDYIQWRGDLTFQQSPFNEVDNLILACLSYVNLDGIEPITKGNSAPLWQVSEIFFGMHAKEELEADKSFIRLAPYMMQDMARCPRYRDIFMGNYVNEIAEKKTLQFSAVELILPDGSSYLSFRGTDDTIVGWKEDFNLSNGIVSAQILAAHYLNHTAGKTKGPVRVGGHSKGGNLAVYAAAKCDPQIRDRILAVYDNDGPGFTREFLQDEDLGKLTDKIYRIIPECSVIGMLLEHVKEPMVVASSQKGILQHDGFSWQVMGPSFVRVQALDKKTGLFNTTLHKWIDGMNMQERDKLIDDLFSVFQATGAQTLTQVQNGGLKSAKAMLKRVEELDPNSKVMVLELVHSLFSRWMEFI